MIDASQTLVQTFRKLVAYAPVHIPEVFQYCLVFSLNGESRGVLNAVAISLEITFEYTTRMDCKPKLCCFYHTDGTSSEPRLLLYVVAPGSHDQNIIGRPDAPND